LYAEGSYSDNQLLEDMYKELKSLINELEKLRDKAQLETQKSSQTLAQE